MVNNSFLFQLIYAGLIGLCGPQDVFFPVVNNESFSRGEVLDFKMTYGIFTIGTGSAHIDKNYFNYSDRDCFKVDITAQTVGMVNWVADVHNQYTAYIDTASLLPLMFYRKQRERNYKKDEQTNFDHPNRKISVRSVDKKTGKWKDPVVFQAPPEVRGMISGFLFLRNMNLSKTKMNDTILIKGFFEDEFYALKIVFKGRAVINTEAGKIRTLVFKPVMPRNKLFEGENSITAFFSDDKNRIPVKIEAKMFIGSAGVELMHYSGLKNHLNTVSD